MKQFKKILTSACGREIILASKVRCEDTGYWIVQGPDFDNLTLSNLKLANIVLEVSDFANARLFNIDWHDMEVTGIFIEAYMLNSRFKDMWFYDGSFMYAKVSECRFESVTFLGTALAWGEFVDCEFINCTFTQSNIATRVDFQEANFSQSKFRNCQFLYADYNEETKFPKGFNPKRHQGLRLMGE